MQDFAAIDFETANNERSSVCSVGVVIVRDGEIVDKFYSLIKPEPEYYNYWCSRVHGLCADDTDSAPIFPEVWAQIECTRKDGKGKADVFANAIKHDYRSPNPTTRWSDVIKLK